MFCADPRVMVVVESELDGAAIDQAAGDLASWAALGNSSRKPDTALHQALRQTHLILVALDFDSPDDQGRRPGAKAWTWWRDTYPNAERWSVPVDKDPGEAVTAGLDLRTWIQAALPWIEEPQSITTHRRKQQRWPSPSTGPPSGNRTIWTPISASG